MGLAGCEPRLRTTPHDVTLERPALLRAGLLAALAAALIAAELTPGGWIALVALMVIAAAVCATVLVAQGGPALTLSLGLALMVFSGNWAALGERIPLDRLVVGVGLASLLVSAENREKIGARMREPMGLLLAVVAIYSILSAYLAGTLQTQVGAYALLDSLGLVPFAFYIIAPVAFATKRDRDYLLTTLVVVGAYLGLTALFEGIHLSALVFPKYIENPNVGIHFGRARGPFVEADAFGLSLFACGVASAIAVRQWAGERKALFAAMVLLLCAGGVIFTLTRAIWIASVVAPLVTVLIFRPTRRFFVPAVLAVAVVGGLAFVLVPSLSGEASKRADEQRPIWDRLNTDAAALRMVEARPLVGFGWATFEAEGPKYLRQAGGYPVTGAGLNVHNVFLSRLAELGLIGTILWLAALIGAIWLGGIRAGPPWMLEWRMGFVAILINWLIVANFVPLTYAMPNAMLWLWAGIAALRQPEEI
jgi:putative inorganic carbon (hco3(-)) transporter